MPFVHNKIPHYVYRVWPLTVVTQNRSSDVPLDFTFGSLSATMDYFSFDNRCENVNPPWEFGKMSGSSNVSLLLCNCVYDYIFKYLDKCVNKVWKIFLKFINTITNSLSLSHSYPLSHTIIIHC